MKLFEVGRLCLKIAGRDAGRKCVIVEIVDDNYALVDGNVRRKKVNIKHLEPLTESVELGVKASHKEVKAAFDKLGLTIWEKKAKQTADRPKKQRKEKLKEKKEEKKKIKEAEEKKAESKKAEKKAAAGEVKSETKPVAGTEKKETSVEELVGEKATSEDKDVEKSAADKKGSA